MWTTDIVDLRCLRFLLSLEECVKAERLPLSVMIFIREVGIFPSFFFFFPHNCLKIIILINLFLGSIISFSLENESPVFLTSFHQNPE